MEEDEEPWTSSLAIFVSLMFLHYHCVSSASFCVAVLWNVLQLREASDIWEFKSKFENTYLVLQPHVLLRFGHSKIESSAWLDLIIF